MASTSTTPILQDTSSSDDFNDVLIKSQKPSFKHTRIPYSHKEEISIVKYIVKNNYAFNVTGVKMWQNMERDKVCKIRTWQSMKQRYLKQIKDNLTLGNQRFPFLTKKDLKLLRLGLNIEEMSKYDKKAIKSQFNDQQNDNLSSDSS